jgi:hypothetical protein
MSSVIVGYVSVCVQLSCILVFTVFHYVGASHGNLPYSYCRWYALLLARFVNTQLALCGAGSGALDVTGRRLVAMVGRLVVEVD